jgi:hypothetical protein
MSSKSPTGHLQDRMMPSHTSGKHLPEHQSKSPSGKMSPRSTSVHMGVVSGQPYTIPQREALQAGQVRSPFPPKVIFGGSISYVFGQTFK